jgi:hypothetical protein
VFVTGLGRSSTWWRPAACCLPFRRCSGKVPDFVSSRPEPFSVPENAAVQEVARGEIASRGLVACGTRQVNPKALYGKVIFPHGKAAAEKNVPQE